MASEESQKMYLQLLQNGGYKLKTAVELFGKPYVWVEAPDGKLFLEKLPTIMNTPQSAVNDS